MNGAAIRVSPAFYGVPFHVARYGFVQADRIRRQVGNWLDALGYGPVETPSRILCAGPVFRLRCYPHRAGAGPALLLIPAPIKRAYIWDLDPRTSVVRRCLEADFRVYLLEWTEPDAAAEGFGLADYADRLIGDCLDAIEAETGRRGVALAGHSLGGTLAALFAALHPGRVRALVLLEAPLCFGKDAGAFAPLVAAAPPAGPLAAAFGTVPGSFLSLVSVAAAPASFQWSRWADWLESLGDPPARATHLRVERWALDELPLPGRLFAESVEWLYREDRFRRGALTLGGRRARPADLTMPILTVVDPRSAIIPPNSVLPVHEAAPSRRKRLLRYDGDRGVALRHVGVLVGASAHRSLWPEILRWLRRAVPTRRDA